MISRGSSVTATMAAMPRRSSQAPLTLFRKDPLPSDLVGGAAPLGAAARFNAPAPPRPPPLGEPPAPPTRLPQRELAATRPELQDATHPSPRPPGSPLGFPPPPSP